MIKRPVKYDPQDMSIQDANFQIICHPWRKVGEPTKDYNERGQEIADCINGIAPVAPFPDAHPVAADSPSFFSKGAIGPLLSKLGKTDLRKLETIEKRLNKFIEKLNEKYAEVEDVPVQA